jgi:hypothetical protein
MLTKMTEEDLEYRAGGIRCGPIVPWRARPRRWQIPGSTAFLHGAQHYVAGYASGVRQLEQHLEALLAAQSFLVGPLTSPKSLGR